MVGKGLTICEIEGIQHVDDQEGGVIRIHFIITFLLIVCMNRRIL